ncbi:hypothetical protein MHPYR_440008 [uncultured Mycobacterium sp.]|uniref:Uncharacterized protein n=1 Tax=uncultured Mycobacterium sp. TaxID=171292 RepID=A0A1Y5PFL0_9MYCO|nr:hypothetical protein MHPYR_440008 [uncultured Mycobacterium sp.]
MVLRGRGAMSAVVLEDVIRQLGRCRWHLFPPELSMGRYEPELSGLAPGRPGVWSSLP